MPADDQGAPPAGRDHHDALVVDLDWRSAALACGAVLALVATFAAVAATSRTLTFVVIGILLALALDPVVDRLQRRLEARRGVAVGLVVVAFFLALGLVAVLVGPETSRQARTLSQDLPDVVAQLNDLPLVGDTFERNDVPAKVEDWINDLPGPWPAGTPTSATGPSRSWRASSPPWPPG